MGGGGLVKLYPYKNGGEGRGARSNGQRFSYAEVAVGGGGGEHNRF